MAIHMRQLHFIFKIRHRAQTTNQDIRLSVAGEIGHQVAKAHHPTLPSVRSLRQRHTFVRGEHGFLLPGLAATAANDMVEHLRRVTISR